MKCNVNLIVDMNNLLSRFYYAQREAPLDEIKALALQYVLAVLKGYQEKYKADDIMCVFDSFKRNWRRLYTDDLEACVTMKKYKGDRKKSLTPKELAKVNEYEKYFEEIYAFLKKYTSIATFVYDKLEADDIIAGLSQTLTQDVNIIISSDKDYLQLVEPFSFDKVGDKPGTFLLNVADDKFRTLDEWDNDPGYFIFEKVIRGEPSNGDNVQSAYPRIRKTRIQKAYVDDYEKTNVMNNKVPLERMEDGELICKVVTTRELVKENIMLMCLWAQPDYIKDLIKTAVSEGLESRSRYNPVKFLKMAKKYDIPALIQDFGKYNNVLAIKYPQHVVDLDHF